MLVISRHLCGSSQLIHTCHRGEEERASSHAVNQSGSCDRYDQAKEGIADLQLNKS